MQKISSKLLRVTELANNVREFHFEGDVEFQPGQFFMLELENGEGRAYSVASADGLIFCVKLVPGGKATEYLWSLKEGDEVSWKGPFGHFVLGEPEGDVIFVATGVGLAPFMAMLEVLFKKGFERQIVLCFGVRCEEDLFYLDKLEKWRDENENFDLNITLSGGSEEWGGKRGRVTEHVQNSDVDNADVYICGNGQMVEDVKKIVKEKGVPQERLHFELFTPV